jgi:hypothetical protein
MKAAPTKIQALSNSFRTLFAASLVIATLGIGIPFVTAPGSMDAAIKLCMLLTLVWIALVIFVFTKFKWRGLWCLLGAPLTGYWFIVLYLIATGCAHNIKNCP